ncbi:MAG: hypothetical protein HZA01_15020 [Nitrospinae bacterium]|nr:hypothetical protein [Nitrospinota bacterium]
METKWLQTFFKDVPPIAMREPLAEILGAMPEGGVVYYTYEDAIKVSGHACASVSLAYKATELGLKALYGNDVPVRGAVEVAFSGSGTHGANGPIGQVISFLTGAAMEYGFHGLMGDYARADKFHFDEKMEIPPGAGFRVIFKRDDNGKMVEVLPCPSRIPLEPEDLEGSKCMPLVLQGVATKEQKEKFFRYWQGKNKKILMDATEGLFQVREISDYRFY